MCETDSNNKESIIHKCWIRNVQYLQYGYLNSKIHDKCLDWMDGNDTIVEQKTIYVIHWWILNNTLQCISIIRGIEIIL